MSQWDFCDEKRGAFEGTGVGSFMSDAAVCTSKKRISPDVQPGSGCELVGIAMLVHEEKRTSASQGVVVCQPDVGRVLTN